MTGAVTRKFDTSDTNDDFILNYVEYQMHAKFGNISETDTVFRFDEMAVDFTDFLALETNFSLLGYGAASGVSILAGLFAMLG